jgi:hypothetical protein
MKLPFDLLVFLALLGVAAVLGWLLHRDSRRRFLANPDNAPPAFGPELAHNFMAYLSDDAAPCCKHCGGGKNHSVHHGKRWTPAPERVNFEDF